MPDAPTMERITGYEGDEGVLGIPEFMPPNRWNFQNKKRKKVHIWNICKNTK